MKWKKKLQQPQYALNSEKVFLTATQPAKSVYSYLQTTRLGLTRAEVEDRQLTYGKNEVVHEQKKNPFIVFIKTFINPFIGVLTGLAVISLVIDVLMAEPGEQEWTGVVIIAVMVVCSAILRFWQEWKANEATDSLMKMVKNTCLVKRTGSGEEELDITVSYTHLDVYKRQMQYHQPHPEAEDRTTNRFPSERKESYGRRCRTRQ